MEQDPFCMLKIDSHDFLNSLDGRSVCPKCQKSRKYYCYTCYVPVAEIQGKVPSVKLPFKIDIIKHPNECDGKSTSAHAGVISPDDVNIYTYPCIPDYPETEKVVLVFPGDASLSLQELAERAESQVDNTSVTDTKELSEPGKNGPQNTAADKSSEQGDEIQTKQSQDIDNSETTKSTKLSENNGSELLQGEDNAATDMEHGIGKRKAEEDSEARGKGSSYKKAKVSAPFDRAIVIDCTWNQTKRISMDERLKNLPCVELKTRQSHFWRHQKDIPSTYLSTIEAIYYFVRDYHDLFMTSEYKGQYDNLLFFFNFMYQKIRKMYKGGEELKAYKQRDGGKPKEKVK